MGLVGSGVGIANFRLRFFVLVFLGVVAFGSVMYWRQQTLLAASYVDIPMHQSKSLSKGDLKSKNFQIEVQDTSPSAK